MHFYFESAIVPSGLPKLLSTGRAAPWFLCESQESKQSCLQKETHFKYFICKDRKSVRLRSIFLTWEQYLVFLSQQYSKFKALKGLLPCQRLNFHVFTVYAPPGISIIGRNEPFPKTILTDHFTAQRHYCSGLSSCLRPRLLTCSRL